MAATRTGTLLKSLTSNAVKTRVVSTTTTRKQNVTTLTMNEVPTATVSFEYEPVREKANNLGSDHIQHKPACKVTEEKVEAGNFGFNKKRDCTIRVAKTKVLISFVVIAKLICAFVFAQAFCWFSYAVAHIELYKVGKVCTILKFQERAPRTSSGMRSKANYKKANKMHYLDKDNENVKIML